MAVDRQKTKGRRSGHSFLRLIHPLLNHPRFYERSPRAIKLLIDVASQYKGNNNGDLVATYSVLRRRGWTSNDQIRKALVELLEARLLILARQGGRKIPSLYALSWEPIDACGGKLEIQATKTAPNTWKLPPLTQTLHRNTGHTEPPHGSKGNNLATELNRPTVHIGGN